MVSEAFSERAFCFTVDDNIRFLKELTETAPVSLFCHPYAAMLRRLHENYDLKIQLNLFYQTEGFTLSQMTDRYAEEWRACSPWLKLSFHSREETVCPYEKSDYWEVYEDACAVQREILRFASRESLAKTTTVHYCQTTEEGLRALADVGVQGLLGLFGTEARPLSSYGLSDEETLRARAGETVHRNGAAIASIDLVINSVAAEQLAKALAPLTARQALRVMIHEQYFYEDYRAYQPNFEAKLRIVFDLLRSEGFQSRFFEETIEA